MAVRRLREDFGIAVPVNLQAISRWQVTGEDGRPGASLVGVTLGPRPCIYHTRALTIEDIVHEMLHVRHPDWPEQLVSLTTESLLTMGSRFLHLP